jgi:phytoene synthase
VNLTEPVSAGADTVSLEAGFAAARGICRRRARDFCFACSFLPARKRNAAYAVCAFCRMTDDAIDVPAGQFVGAAVARHHPVMSLRVVEPPPVLSDDSCAGGDSLQMRLALLRRRLDEIYDDRLELPAVEARSEQQHALHAFARTVREYEIPKQHFLDLAEGFRMDRTIGRYQTWRDLERCCDHVAGTVGRMMSCVLGLTHSDAHRQAAMVGIAMRLTRILRDVKQDYARGRIYLPLEDLARFGYRESDLATGTVNDSFRRLMRFEVSRARRLYRQGADGLCWLAGDGSRLTASVMTVVSSGVLDAIERARYDVFSRRIGLTTGQKLRRLPGAWRLARRRADRPLPRVL